MPCILYISGSPLEGLSGHPLEAVTPVGAWGASPVVITSAQLQCIFLTIVLVCVQEREGVGELLATWRQAWGGWKGGDW